MRARIYNAMRFPVALAVAAFVSGCATVGPDYQRPETPLPQAFPSEAAAPTGSASVVDPQWWRAFGDPQLNALVESAIANNTDLLAAVARVERADAQLREVGGALFPSVTAGSSATRSRQLMGGQHVHLTSLGLNLASSFEVDFWGKLQRANEAARAQLLATSYARDVVRLSVAGLTAQSYFTLRSLDEQIAILRDTLISRDEQLKVMKARVNSGVSGQLEFDQAQVLRADAAVQLRELQRQRSLALTQLGLLTADPGLAVAEGRLEQPVPVAPPAGLPSSLLLRRPDVQQAEQQLVAANAQVGVARAAMFPTVSLTGLLGSQSTDLSDLLASGSRIWSLGFGLSVPLFDGGRLAARTDQAWAGQREAIAVYQGAVQSAFQDTADALVNLRAARESQEDVHRRWMSSANALRLAKLRYEAGYSPYLELLDAQRTANAAQLEVVRNRQAQLSATVNLWRALGGGWAAQDTAKEAG